MPNLLTVINSQKIFLLIEQTDEMAFAIRLRQASTLNAIH
jgi:hypothetical protein